MFVIGISGGIGCGKSTAADFFRQHQVPVLDADEIARRSCERGQPALEELVQSFGPEILDAHGNLDRAKMAQLAFSNHRLLDQLSRITHRHVTAVLQKEVEKARRRKLPLLVLDVPIPIKEGFLDLVDYVLIIWASEDLRLERLEARGLGREEARARMRLQMSREDYGRLADCLLSNDGTREELDSALEKVCAEVLGARGLRLPPKLEGGSEP